MNGRQNPGNATDLFFIGSCIENFFVIIIIDCIEFSDSLVENYMSCTCTNLLKYTKLYCFVNLDDKNSWQKGFFDHKSFHEILQPWAQTVVTGRARFVSLISKTKSILQVIDKWTFIQYYHFIFQPMMGNTVIMKSIMFIISEEIYCS